LARAASTVVDNGTAGITAPSFAADAGEAINAVQTSTTLWGILARVGRALHHIPCAIGTSVPRHTPALVLIRACVICFPAFAAAEVASSKVNTLVPLVLCARLCGAFVDVFVTVSPRKPAGTSAYVLIETVGTGTTPQARKRGTFVDVDFTVGTKGTSRALALIRAQLAVRDTLATLPAR
jgi:hypothetical protein